MLQHWERGSDCSAPVVALPGRVPLRCWVAILSIVMLSCPKDVDAATYTVSPDGGGDRYTLANVSVAFSSHEKAQSPEKTS